MEPQCPTLQPGLAGWPWGCHHASLGPDPFLAQRLLGRPESRRQGKCLIPSLPAPHPQGHREMSILQLLGAEVTPAQQITLKVEQRPPVSLLRPGLGSMGRGSAPGKLAAPA